MAEVTPEQLSAAIAELNAVRIATEELMQTIALGGTCAGTASGEVSATTQHPSLIGRELANQHPVTAITGLQTILDGIDTQLNAMQAAIDSGDTGGGTVTEHTHIIEQITGLRNELDSLASDINSLQSLIGGGGLGIGGGAGTSSMDTAIRALNPVSFYGFAEANESSVLLDDGGSYPGTYTGHPVLEAPGISGASSKAAVFNGINAKAHIPSSNGNQFNHSFSVGIIFTANPSNAEKVLLDRWSADASNKNYYLSVRDTGVVRGIVNNGSSDVYLDNAGAAVVNDSAPHFALLQFDETAQQVELFVDGISVATASVTSIQQNSVANVSIGHYGINEGHVFNGIFYKLFFIDRAITQTEIDSIQALMPA